MMNEILTPVATWLPMSPLEIVATAFGLWSVWAYTRESLWAWPSGLLNVLMYIVLFWHGKLYGETALQVVFVILQIYGWWQWLRGGERHAGVVIGRTSARLWGVLAAIAVGSIVPIGLGLAHWTDSTTPWWDAIPTVLSLIAQWMISQKKLENWLVWIVVDLFSIPLFAAKGFYLTAGLYGVFLILCCIGLRQWLRLLRSTAAA
jgi:nicotinamide mononucleotide transporter